MSKCFKNVLCIGPQYVNHRGGMGAVLEIYSKHLTPFKFISTYPAKSFLYNNLVFLNAIYRFIEILISDRDIKIIHLHSASKGSFYRKSILILIGKMFRKKIIMHVHGGLFSSFFEKRGYVMKSYIKAIINKSDKLICISERSYNFFLEIADPSKIIVLPNPVEIKKSTHQSEIVSPVRLLFLGMLNENKGIYDLLKIISDHKDYFRNKIKLNIGGDGDVARLQNVIKENDLDNFVEFNGWVNGTEKEKLLDECDALILPSYYEELPMCILEAMSYGKAIIATKVGGIPSVVKHGFNGWLLEPGDMNDLYKILSTLICNNTNLKNYGENSLQIIKDFSIEEISEKLYNIYGEVNLN